VGVFQSASSALGALDKRVFSLAYNALVHKEKELVTVFCVKSDIDAVITTKEFLAGLHRGQHE
jgi:hypothetical protein